MVRENVSDLIAFLAVARTGSFTRAAQQLGVSQPALSHALKELEGRLGLRLLNRTTRSVSTTEAGERLLRMIAPHFDGIEAGLAALTELRDKPAGTVRITVGDQPAELILLPAVAGLLPAYPDLKVEISVNNGFVDIVAERFDAGVRLGETSRRTWSPSGSGRTCAWPSWARHPTSPGDLYPGRLTIWPNTSASACGTRRKAGLAFGT